MKPQIDYTLYLCTDRSLMTEESIEECVELAVKGGVTVVQLREKDCSCREFYEVAKSVKEVTDAYEIPLIINDSVEVALAVGADGVHLGKNDLPIGVARNLLGADKIIGATVYTVEEAVRAMKSGADYLRVGPVFRTSRVEEKLIPPEDMKKICNSVEIPVVAIGGINKENISELRALGIRGVAVVSAIVEQKNVTAAAEDLIAAWRAEE